MDYDYSRRGYLLPNGCKDLIDVIHPKTDITQARDFFFVRIPLPGFENADIQIFAEANTLRVIAKHTSENKIKVPIGFAIAKARAIYLNDHLYITVPKA